MKILMIEDNFAIGEPIRDEIRNTFGEAHWLETESDFHEEWRNIAGSPPRAAVIDVMLKWDILRREKRFRPPGPRDMYRAGIRCADTVLDDPRTKHIPIILFSVIDRPDLAEDIERLGKKGNVTYLQKSSEPSQLISLLRQVTSVTGRAMS